MDAFEFFSQGKFKELAQQSGLNQFFFIIQFLISLISIIIIFIIIKFEILVNIFSLSFAVILIGFVLGVILKSIAFSFMKEKKYYFLENLFPLSLPFSKILFPYCNHILNKNMRYMYILWGFCWYVISYSSYQVIINGKGGGYCFVICFFSFSLPLINYLLIMLFEYKKYFR